MEFASEGSLCKKRSASSALASSGESISAFSNSGSRGSAGTASLSESPACSLHPVCVRESGFGTNSSSSSRMGGRSLVAFLESAGDRFSEPSNEYEEAESMLGRVGTSGWPSTSSRSNPVGALVKGFGRCPRPIEPSPFDGSGGGVAWVLMLPTSSFCRKGGESSPPLVSVLVTIPLWAACAFWLSRALNFGLRVPSAMSS